MCNFQPGKTNKHHQSLVLRSQRADSLISELTNVSEEQNKDKHKKGKEKEVWLRNEIRHYKYEHTQHQRASLLSIHSSRIISNKNSHSYRPFVRYCICPRCHVMWSYQITRAPSWSSHSSPGSPRASGSDARSAEGPLGRVEWWPSAKGHVLAWSDKQVAFDHAQKLQKARSTSGGALESIRCTECHNSRLATSRYQGAFQKRNTMPRDYIHLKNFNSP